MARPLYPEDYLVRDRRFWTRPEPEVDEPPLAHPPPEPPRPVEPDRVAVLESELADRDRRLRELAALVRRHEQEADAVKQRLGRESERELARRTKELLADWLGALDDLDRAIAAGRRAEAGTPLLAGVELARDNLLAGLAGRGVRRLEPTGERFDPRRHEAIARVPVEPERDGVVLETFAPGYTLGDELVRPARVAVGHGGR
jgi:molecular chaperone GrpE